MASYAAQDAILCNTSPHLVHPHNQSAAQTGCMKMLGGSNVLTIVFKTLAVSVIMLGVTAKTLSVTAKTFGVFPETLSITFGNTEHCFKNKPQFRQQ